MRITYKPIEELNYNKCLGMLIGLHTGDALGAPLEFIKRTEIKTRHTEITGGGRHNWEPGAPTDDTTLMILILESLVEFTSLNQDDITQKFIKWYNSHPKDIGNTTKKAIENHIRGVDNISCAPDDDQSQSNGSLMRAAPLALLHYETNSELIEKVALQTQITHGHSTCLLADYLLIRALKLILRGDTKRKVFQEVLELSHMHDEFYKNIKKIPELSSAQVKTSGFVIDTFCAALWGFYHFPTFEDSLIQVVNLGDDADTVGAVCGALCGAHYGVNEIPERWISQLKQKTHIEALLKNFMASYVKKVPI